MTDTEIKMCPCCGRDVLMEDGTLWHSDSSLTREQQLLCSEDPRIWRPLRF